MSCVNKRTMSGKPLFGYMQRVASRHVEPMSCMSRANVSLCGVSGKWPSMLTRESDSILDLDLSDLEESLDRARDLGHKTKWHFAVGFKPKWVPAEGYSLAYQTKRIEDNLAYIDTVMRELGHKIDIVDAINEPLQPDGSGFRHSPNHDKITVEEIATYLKYIDAHPCRKTNLQIGINEYGVERNGLKQDTLYQLCLQLRDELDAPLDYVGMQCHLDAADPPNRDELQQSFQRFADAGFAVHITELDIRVAGVDAYKLRRQEEVAEDLLVAARRAGVHYVITWGTTDNDSWIYAKHGIDYPDEQPLPYNVQNAPKPFGQALEAHTR